MCLQSTVQKRFESALSVTEPTGKVGYNRMVQRVRKRTHAAIAKVHVGQQQRAMLPDDEEGKVASVRCALDDDGCGAPLAGKGERLLDLLWCH